MALRDTVFEHLNPDFRQGYTVYMDNYCGSVHMPIQLHKQNTEICGTIREDTTLASDLKDHQKTLKKGEMTFQRVRRCFFNHGWTKKAITMKYTVHSAEMVDVSNRFC
jgi:hypothetical protein